LLLPRPGPRFYHVLNRGNGKQEVFHKNGDYAAFIDLMKEAKEMELMRESVNRQSPYGQADWRITIRYEEVACPLLPFFRESASG